MGSLLWPLYFVLMHASQKVRRRLYISLTRLQRTPYGANSTCGRYVRSPLRPAMLSSWLYYRVRAFTLDRQNAEDLQLFFQN